MHPLAEVGLAPTRTFGSIKIYKWVFTVLQKYHNHLYLSISLNKKPGINLVVLYKPNELLKKKGAKRRRAYPYLLGPCFVLGRRLDGYSVVGSDTYVSGRTKSSCRVSVVS